jgi:glycosyltransferase involved in cell wall biosynthesis
MPPRVTVIIPTYNWSSVLPYSIGSVLAQTFTDFELLVVGDGCTDDSAAVVGAIEDPRVRWIDLQPGTGHQSGPNNEGLRQGRGELIAYLGHDDLWFRHHLSAAVAALDAGGDLAHSVVAMIGPDGVRAEPNRIPHARPSWIAPSAVVHRRSVIDRIGGWGDYRELSVDPEVDLWRRVYDAGLAFTFVPRLTVVKFPASMRRDVYRARPCHEQAIWAQRMRTEPDLEMVELAHIVKDLSRPSTGIASRIWRLIDPRHWIGRIRRRKGAGLTARQRFKGLDRP